MKTRVKDGVHRFQLKVKSYANSYYIDRVAKLEELVARNLASIQIDLIGIGELPADTALLIRSVLLRRPPATRLVTYAHSSLQGGSVLVWLMGDVRLIRDDARVFFRDTTLPEDERSELVEVLKYHAPKYRDSYASSHDPEEWDYVRVLELINEFLPVGELAGRALGVPLLRQFRLIDNEKFDGFLASVFSKSARALTTG